MKRNAVARFALAVVAAIALATCFTFAQQPSKAKPKKTEAQKQQKAIAAMSAPWPDADTLRKRRTDAESRPLFQSADPVTFTLRADFNAVTRDRNPNSTAAYPATLIVTDQSGREQSIPVRLRTRGSVRLNLRVCSFPPIRVDFPKSGLKGTVFAGQESLKLVPHCVNSAPYEQYILRELLAYRIFNLFTGHSFRVRQGKGSYVDAASGRLVANRYAFFVENDEDVARRMEGRVADITGQFFSVQDDDTLVLMTLLQWMIGNTDYSISVLHNIRLVQRQDSKRYPIAYDFDSSGLVGPPYAAPDRRLGIVSVRDRLFRGPCRPMERYEAFLAKFREKQQDVFALIDGLPGLTDASRRATRSYMDEFYSMINNPNRARKALLEACLNSARM